MSVLCFSFMKSDYATLNSGYLLFLFNIIQLRLIHVIACFMHFYHYIILYYTNILLYPFHSLIQPIFIECKLS